MLLRGPGHHVGPEGSVEGNMAFEIVDKIQTFLLVVREDKDFDDSPRRRESAVEIPAKEFKELFDTWLARRLASQHLIEGRELP